MLVYDLLNVIYNLYKEAEANVEVIHNLIGLEVVHLLVCHPYLLEACESSMTLPMCGALEIKQTLQVLEEALTPKKIS